MVKGFIGTPFISEENDVIHNIKNHNSFNKELDKNNCDNKGIPDIIKDIIQDCDTGARTVIPGHMKF